MVWIASLTQDGIGGEDYQSAIQQMELNGAARPYYNYQVLIKLINNLKYAWL